MSDPRRADGVSEGGASLRRGGGRAGLAVSHPVAERPGTPSARGGSTDRGLCIGCGASVYGDGGRAWVICEDCMTKARVIAAGRTWQANEAAEEGDDDDDA